MIVKTYRPDIDGLRAYAVMAVLLFHLNLAPFSGGFVGVDVFFVISGYLITGNILRQVSGGTFSLSAFYITRFRRLFPALFVTAIVTFAVGAALMSPAYFADLSQSTLYALASVSNFHFWAGSGYFEAEAIYKPMLHTWSLSVEEQFYLLFPVFVMLTLKIPGRFMLPAFLALGGALSLMACHWFLDGRVWAIRTYLPQVRDFFEDGPSTIFFLAPFRAFEFAIGALVVWVPALRWRWLSEAALICGLALIAFSIVTFTATTVTPGVNALIPCVGAALVLYAGRAPLVGKMLDNRLAVWLGRISYSVYLVHWPIIVFYYYVTFGDVGPVATGLLLLASIAAGTALHHFVEMPFRRGSKTDPMVLRRGAASGVLASMAMLAAVNTASQDGWLWRLSLTSQALVLSDEAALAEINGAIEPGRGCDASCVFGNEESRKTILLVGDSHANHLTKELAALGPEYRFELFQGPSCFFGADLRHNNPVPSRRLECEAQNERLAQRLREGGIYAVIQAQRWHSYNDAVDAKTLTPPIVSGDITSFRETLFLDAAGLYAGLDIPVVFVSGAPGTNADCAIRPAWTGSYCPPRPLTSSISVAAAADMSLASLPDRFRFVDTAELICPDGACRIFSDEGRVLYTDNHHLSVDGAALVVPSVLAALDQIKVMALL